MSSVINLNELTSIVQGVSDHILDYALLLAAVGTVAMALIELVKAITWSRFYFHRGMVESWTSEKPGVLSELLNLSAGGVEWAKALYDQPAGKMMGQLQAAANVALDFPTVYPSLYNFLASGSAIVDGTSDQQKWMSFAPRLAQGIPREETARAAFEGESREGTQARARLGNLVTRKLDAFQTRVEYLWARANQTAAIATGAALFYYVLSQTQDISKVNMFTRIAISVLAGMISPFAKDVVTALAGLRTRRT